MDAKKDFENPNLFTENPPGEYTYSTTKYGLTAEGQLQRDDNPQRDSAVQLAAGGEERRGKDDPYGPDDGGHLIGARFGGSPGKENATAQNRNLNRSDYKRMENEMDRKLGNSKVYTHMESFNANGGQRPTHYMGHVITETVDENGKTTRTLDYVSFNNESRAEQDKWAQAEANFYAANPDAEQEQMSQNTAMPYIWDEELGNVVDNPYYVDPEATQTVTDEVDEDYSVGIEADVGADNSADNGADNDQGMD